MSVVVNKFGFRKMRGVEFTTEGVVIMRQMAEEGEQGNEYSGC